MKQVKQIWGAGLAGLVAAQAFQNATIIERREKSPEGTHKALLRFRSPAVGEFLGIPFRPVTVRKGIWFNGRYVEPTIQRANWYARKVIGRLADRSIWNLETVERYIAPEDLVPQLLARFDSRIQWGKTVEATIVKEDHAVVSTLPIGVLAKLYGGDHPPLARQAVQVKRWRVRNSDVHQTVYFPDPDIALYRASITGDLLIAEYVVDDGFTGIGQLGPLLEPFGLRAEECDPIEDVSQEYGKIAPINEAWRRSFVFRMSNEHGVYSLGRFGTWRNILIDDVLQDVNVIRRLLNTDSYGARQAMFSQ